MSISIQMKLHKYGRGVGTLLANISIWTEVDGEHHGYRISLPETEISGKIKKRCSGHQNVLHVLQEVLANADLDKLGLDYITRGGYSPYGDDTCPECGLGPETKCFHK
jgi:hypothetical protein